MSGLSVLQPYVTPRAVVDAPEKCQLCATPIAEAHPHVVDLEKRSLCCSCTACSLLFLQPGPSNGRYRTVPNRVLSDPGFVLTECEWDELKIPVRLAFFLFNSQRNRWVVSYPSPAGAVESELSFDAWADIAERSPLVRSLEPDVEAILTWGRNPSAKLVSYLVPVDCCYELVAIVRKSWRGFHGGEARDRIESFFHALEQRSRPVDPRGAR